MFGRGKKRKALIMEMVEHRLRFLGYDDRQTRLELKKLGGFHLLGMPEGTIVTVAEISITNQKRSIPIERTLGRLEVTRKLRGQDVGIFQQILDEAVGPEPGMALISYCLYRIKIENAPIAPFFDLHLTMELMKIAYEEVLRW